MRTFLSLVTRGDAECDIIVMGGDLKATSQKT